jgi:hypothetical protein
MVRAIRHGVMVVNMRLLRRVRFIMRWSMRLKDSFTEIYLLRKSTAEMVTEIKKVIPESAAKILQIVSGLSPQQALTLVILSPN